MVKINEIGIIQNANLNSATSTNTQKTPNNSIFANNPTDNKPKVISEGEVKVKGDDGKKYKAYEVVTQEVDDKGQTWNVAVRTYTDDNGTAVKDTIKTNVRTERFGKEDVEITTRKTTHVAGNVKKTVEEEESKYHYSEKHEEWHGNKGQTGNSKRSKMKQCKMPPGFSAKYLSTSISVTKIQFENE